METKGEVSEIGYFELFVVAVFFFGIAARHDDWKFSVWPPAPPFLLRLEEACDGEQDDFAGGAQRVRVRVVRRVQHCMRARAADRPTSNRAGSSFKEQNNEKTRVEWS